MTLSRSGLFGDLDVDITPNAPLGAMTWYGVGGHADWLIRPRDINSLVLLMKRCQRSQTPLRILGSGANLLISDEGVDGLVVKLDSTFFKELNYHESSHESRVQIMAGADLTRVVMDTTRRGLDGMSALAGIPASVGGAIRMNAGGAFGAIGDVVYSVTCLTRQGEKVTYHADQLRFEYRSTNIPDPIILSATFDLQPTDPITLRERVKEIFAYKKSTQPLGESTAGCAFKNPVDPVTEQRVSAGKLIDQAGLKGLAVGGATVSRQHANFIVTQPGALSEDVIKLIKQIKQHVYDHAGIELEEEIIIWRRDEDDADLP